MDLLSASAAEVAFSESEPDVPNGAWTWFSDERAVVDSDCGADGPRVLVGSVAARDGPDGGDINVLWYDAGTGDTGHATLHESLEQDDHNGPALLVRPDGRYLAMYTRHGNDPYTRWRVSTDPHDPTRWEPERTFENGAGATYNNVYHLPDDAEGAGRTYSFGRTVGWDPNALVSDDQGSSWSYGGRLVNGEEGERPYVRYCRVDDRIHFITTEDHPGDRNNGVYHGYVRDGTLFDSTGRTLSDIILDGSETTPTPEDLTTVFDPSTFVDGVEMTRAWTVDVSADDRGRPVAIFQTRADGDPTDHRFFYARFDGSDWHVSQVAKAGSRLYDDQDDYTGLASIDPGDAAQIVVSTTVDPRDDTELDYRELFAGATDDRGDTWNWRPLTPDASTENLRPLLPAWADERTAVVWMRGQYRTFEDWDTQVVGRLYEP